MTNLLKKFYEKIDFWYLDKKNPGQKKCREFFGGVWIELAGRIGAEKTRLNLLFPAVKLQLAQL